MKRKNRKWTIIIVLLSIIAFFVFKTLNPSGPITEHIPNQVRDRATLSKNFNESSIQINPLRNLYFGDLHVHTELSFDAFIGGTTSSPDDAYRFAKGQEIRIFNQNVKINRPLDFAAVTDHSEFLGELYSIQTKGAPAYYSALAFYFRSIGTDTVKQRALFRRTANRLKEEPTHLPFFQGFETTKSAWDIELEAAEKHYEPGKFTTFAAYEWTLGAAQSHVHRNVFFRDMKVPDYPVSALEARNEDELWASLEDFTEKGATLIAIPHNTNLSKAQGFLDKTRATAFIQNKFEPLVEVHQAKGNSEVAAEFWQNDEFAGFENYSYDPSFKNNYLRDALKRGLEYEEKFGINPFKFGMIGSTDTHNGTPGNTEEWGKFIGHHAFLDINQDTRRTRQWILEPNLNKRVYDAVNPGGLVAVWAEANTRGHIFDALKRRETYATSGGRIKVRFFAGFDFDPDYEDYEKLVKAGYDKGVPMGSDLEMKNGLNKKPQFLIWATKDPEGANLDRIQVVKGWYINGELKEKIFNVAVSDGRPLNLDGSTTTTAASVNMKTGEWSKDKGAVELQTVWTDQDFDPSSRAFYYVRVLENPTARFSLWDEIRYGIDYPASVPLTVQERAWSSPIWYSP